jgi:hypothetical protein
VRRTALKRVGNHRRELRFGRDLALNGRTTGELADGRSLLGEFDLELQQDARLYGLAELRGLDRHEIDELAGVRET